MNEQVLYLDGAMHGLFRSSEGEWPDRPAVR